MGMQYILHIEYYQDIPNLVFWKLPGYIKLLSEKVNIILSEKKNHATHIIIYCHELNMALDWASQALQCPTRLQLLTTAWYAASHWLLQYICSLQITTCLKVQGEQFIVFYSMVKEHGIKERVGWFTQWMWFVPILTQCLGLTENPRLE